MQGSIFRERYRIEEIPFPCRIQRSRVIPQLAEVCELNPECIPDRKEFSRAADRTNIEAFRQVAIDMTKECISLGLMKGRIIGVDGSLIKSNTSADKNKETLSPYPI